MPTTIESIDRPATRPLGEPVRRTPKPRFSLVVERYLPWSLAAAAFALAAWRRGFWLFGVLWSKDLVGNVVAACAIFVAYLLTAATILPAVEEKAIIKKLRDWGYYTFVVNYIARAAWSAGLLLLLSLSFAPLAEILSTRVVADRLYSAVWWALCLYTVGAVYVATKILLKMLKAR